MGNIDEEDNVVKRLGKLTPVYIVSLFGAVGFVIGLFENQQNSLIAAIILIVISVPIVIFVEYKMMKVRRVFQIVIAALNGVLWLFLMTVSYFSYIGLTHDIYIWIQFAIAFWTFIIPFFYK